MKKQMKFLTLGAALLGGAIASASDGPSLTKDEFANVTMSFSKDLIEGLFTDDIFQLDHAGKKVTIDLQKLKALSDTNHDNDLNSLVQRLQNILSGHTSVTHVGPEFMPLSSQDRMGGM